MTTTRLVFIEGPPHTGRTRLGQELMLQYAVQSRPHQFWSARSRDNPLLRPHDPAAYPSAASYAAALEVQWQNFATRATTTTDTFICAGALLQPGFRSLLAAGADAEHLQALIARLLLHMSDLQPTLLYLSRADVPATADPDWARWRDCCAGLFADLPQHRLLLNASRSEPQELLRDALDFLDLPHIPVLAERQRIARFAGRYAAGDQSELVIEPTTAGTAARVRLPAALLGGDARQEYDLLPMPDGGFLVAGEDLALRPEESGGRMRGLHSESGDPLLAALPAFLTRIAD